MSRGRGGRRVGSICPIALLGALALLGTVSAFDVSNGHAGCRVILDLRDDTDHGGNFQALRWFKRFYIPAHCSVQFFTYAYRLGSGRGQQLGFTFSHVAVILVDF